MFSSVQIKDVDFKPALFCAPLAGFTHSAFRRLVAEFGGCGCFWTEMLAGRQILREDPELSPCLRRSPLEKKLIYQLMIREGDPIEQIIHKVEECGPDGLDLNLACHAPAIRHLDAGSQLFENVHVLRSILQDVRKFWKGLLSVKIRLGRDAPDWQVKFIERLKLFEEMGVDVVVLHPRFFEDKYKRRARHELLPWVTSITRLPIVMSGDITGPDLVAEKNLLMKNVCAVMVGRLAVVRPWVFAAWDRKVEVDHAAVWFKMFDYICADFPSEVAIARLKIFTKFYSRNFHFGHGFCSTIHHAPSLQATKLLAADFFQRSPTVESEPNLMGLA